MPEIVSIRSVNIEKEGWMSDRKKRGKLFDSLVVKTSTSR